MERKSSSVGTVIFWWNVRKMIQIYLQQRRKCFAVSVLVIAFYLMIVSVPTLILLIHRDGMSYYYVLGGYGGFVAVGVIIMLGYSLNLLSNERISMYPGNAMSRYLSRLLADHALMLGYTLLVGLMYLLQSGLFWLVLHGREGMDVQQFFDVRYLGLGMLRIYLTWMMIYGIFAVLLALYARWGMKVLMSFVGISLLIVFVEWYLAISRVTFLAAFMKIVAWWEKWTTENTDLLSYVGFSFTVWIVCMLVAVIIVHSMRMWRCDNTGIYAVMMVFVGLSINVAVLFASTDAYYGGRDIRYGEEGSSQQDGVLTSQLLVELPWDCSYPSEDSLDYYFFIDEKTGKKYGKMMDYFNLNCESELICVSQASDTDLPKDLDLSAVDDEHILFWYQMDNVRVNGREIYEDFMENLTKHLIPAYDDGKFEMEYHGTLNAMICNDFFPGIDRFLYHDKGDMMMDEYIREPIDMQVFIVMSDARLEQETAEE